MGKIIELIATLRSEKGKGASRRLRRLANQVPAILYGAGKESKTIALEHNHVIHSLENKAIYSSIITLSIDNAKEPVVLKDIQRHPFKPKVLHMDFKRIKADEEIEILVPVKFIGADVAPGIKVGGGAPTYHMKEIEISCLPADLPEFVEVDFSKLELNDSIHLSDVILPNKVQLTADLKDPDENVPVVSIYAIKEMMEPETGKPEETPTTEITTEKAKEEPSAK